MIHFSPYPLGKQYAFTFVDDTDLSTRPNTEPVYEFLAAHGFWGTKTVWPLRARRTSSFRRADERADPLPHSGATLEDDDYRDFVKRLKALGFEIALHGAAAGNSTREEVKLALERFREILGAKPDVNAFHQTNLENLYCGVHKLDSQALRLLERFTDRSEYEGHCEDSLSFWGDIARDTFRYVRLPFHTIDEINTLKVNPSMPFHDPRRPYVRCWFSASDGADLVRFNRLLSETNVRRLAAERGACIIYTHFAKGFARTSGSGYVLDSGFERTVERVTSDPRAWFTTTRELLDRLAAVRALALRHEGHRVEITYSGDEPCVEGLSIHVPDDVRVQDESGRTLETTDGRAGLPRLRNGQTLIWSISRTGRQIIAPSDPHIARRERRGIEYRNYAGLVRGWLRDRWYYRDVMPLRLLPGALH